MKKISIMIPCYNEVENVEPMSFAVVNVMEELLVDMIMNSSLLITVLRTVQERN